MVRDSYVQWIRKKLGTRKIFLPFVTVIVRNQKNQILVQRRIDLNVWGLPGGVLELNEDLDSCARRELKEETGLSVGPLRLIGVYTDPKYEVTYPNGDQVQQFTICLEGLVSGGRMRPDGVESNELVFYSSEEIKNLDMPIWYRDMIADAIRYRVPRFNPPRRVQDTEDQIAAVRSYIGSAIYSGTGAAVIVENEKGLFLMLQHKGEKDWRPPAGFSDLGENVAYTAVREMKEETGLDIMPQRILAVHATPKLNVTYPNGDRTRTVGVIFKAELLGGKLSLDQKEINQLAWMTKEEALESYNSKRRWFIERVIEHLDEGYFIC